MQHGQGSQCTEQQQQTQGHQLINENNGSEDPSAYTAQAVKLISTNDNNDDINTLPSASLSSSSVALATAHANGQAPGTNLTHAPPTPHQQATISSTSTTSPALSRAGAQTLLPAVALSPQDAETDALLTALGIAPSSSPTLSSSSEYMDLDMELDLGLAADAALHSLLGAHCETRPDGTWTNDDNADEASLLPFLEADASWDWQQATPVTGI